jgi:hypothetical protein
MLVVAMTVLVCATPGCASLTAYAKDAIRDQALKASDKLVDRVIDKVGERIDVKLSEEAVKEIRAAAKTAAREEIARLLSNDEIDKAAAAEPPKEEVADASETTPAPTPQ